MPKPRVLARIPGSEPQQFLLLLAQKPVIIEAKKTGRRHRAEGVGEDLRLTRTIPTMLLVERAAGAAEGKLSEQMLFRTDEARP